MTPRYKSSFVFILTLMRRILRKLFVKKQWNLIIDQSISPIQKIEMLELSVSISDLPSDSYWSWLYATDLLYRDLYYPHKKALEFFFSQHLLKISVNDKLLDAAGGRPIYLEAIRETSGCRNLFLCDHVYEGITEDSLGIKTIGGEVTRIHLPAASISKISCHHAFEHFQNDADIKFIEEIGRLLSPGGLACLIPLFLSDQYVECWNIPQIQTFDPQAELIIDDTASLPGNDDDGHFARIYDVRSLEQRVINTALKNNLRLKIIECRLDGQILPDMKKNFGSILNQPLRSLVLKKL